MRGILPGNQRKTARKGRSAGGVGAATVAYPTSNQKKSAWQNQGDRALRESGSGAGPVRREGDSSWHRNGYSASFHSSTSSTGSDSVYGHFASIHSSGASSISRSSLRSSHHSVQNPSSIRGSFKLTKPPSSTVADLTSAPFSSSSTATATVGHRSADRSAESLDYRLAQPPNGHQSAPSLDYRSAQHSMGHQSAPSLDYQSAQQSSLAAIVGTSSAESMVRQPSSRTQFRRINLPSLPEHTRNKCLPGLDSVVSKELFRDWASSFRRLDPRYQILEYLNDVATFGAARIEKEGVSRSVQALGPILRAFKRSGVFSVWRPTSKDAIRKMMKGTGTGKGLDIKGKSAKRGVLSGFVPFVQIHDDEEHKRAIRSLPMEARIRVFYGEREVRDEAAERLRTVSDEMVRATEEDEAMLADKSAELSDQDEAIARLERWEMKDPSVTILDEYASQGCYGVEISERLFWEAYVMRESIARGPEGSPYETGRDSEPDFQDMNFVSTRNGSKKSTLAKGGPRPVIWQQPHPETGYENPMNPLSLLVAYEEVGRVIPVVSDFDCFLIGTRGVSYDEPLAEDQVSQLDWCIDGIESILDAMNGPDGIHAWTTQWFGVLKEKGKKKKVVVPQYGFGDSKSYSIVENAVKRLKNNGAVRHGAECFNFYFPQELDDEFLVVSDDLNGKIPWAYMNREQLRSFLLGKVDDGYTFPLNPKWVLCDEGWKEIYDKLLASTRPNVAESIDAWLPPESGLRERIEAISRRHRGGFRRSKPKPKKQLDFSTWVAGGSNTGGGLLHQIDELSKALPPESPSARARRSIALLRKSKVYAKLDRQATEGTAAMDLAELEVDQEEDSWGELEADDLLEILPQTTLNKKVSDEGLVAGGRRAKRNLALLRRSRMLDKLDLQDREGSTAAMDLAELELSLSGQDEDKDEDKDENEDWQIEETSRLLGPRGGEGESVPGAIRKPRRSLAQLRKSKIIDKLDRQTSDGTTAMDLAELALDRDEALRRAKTKLRTVIVWSMATREARAKNNAAVDSDGDEEVGKLSDGGRATKMSG